MFSSSHISPHLTLFKSQSPSLVDAQPDLPKYRGYIHKIKGCSSIWHNHCLNFPILNSHQSLNHSHSSLTSVGSSYYSMDSSMVGHWLQLCSTIGKVKEVHAVVLKHMKDPGLFVNNNLISMYVKFGNMEVSRWVFDNMVERNVVSWTAMLNGYERHGIWNEALELFTEFVNRGLLGNAQTFVCVLNLCSRLFDYELGRQLHAYIIKSQVSNFILDCAVLHFYARCGDLDCAFEVFERIQKRDLIAWTTIITACSQHGWGQEAISLFSEMLSDGLDPNEFTICSVLNACGDEKELCFGKQIHGAVVKKAYDMDIYTVTSLVDMYAKCGNIEDSRIIFDGMKRKNAVSWNTMIAGYARNGLGEEAIALFRVMTRLKVPSNSLTTVSIIRACGLLKELSAGKEVHAGILKSFTLSNIFVGSALVWLYCKCGDYTSAAKVLQNLPDKDVVSWTAMISGCSHLGHEYEALEYLEEMLREGVGPNPFTYSSALKACAKLEDINRGKLIHSSVNKTPAFSNVYVGSALVHMYAKCGHLSDAVQVFDSMPEKNLVSWKAMIVAYARNGHCSEALKLMHRIQAEGITVDDYILSAVLTSCGDFKWGDEKAS